MDGRLQAHRLALLLHRPIPLVFGFTPGFLISILYLLYNPSFSFCNLISLLVKSRSFDLCRRLTQYFDIMVSTRFPGAVGIAFSLLPAVLTQSVSTSNITGISTVSSADVGANSNITVSQQASLACSALSNTTIETQSYPLGLLESDYLEAKDHYWSAANADNTPACVVFPSSAEEVSEIVSILLDYPNVNFAVKSGGHNPNVGYSSVDGGVLISMRSNLSNTTISADSSIAYVHPGARWSEAVTALEPYGVSVVGGRIGMFDVLGMRRPSLTLRRRCWCWGLPFGWRSQLSQCRVWHGL